MKPDATTVFSFPMKAPEGAVVTADMTAIEQLEMWLAYQRAWCEHKPSVTINVKSDEWFEVGAFVYKFLSDLCPECLFHRIYIQGLVSSYANSSF